MDLKFKVAQAEKRFASYKGLLVSLKLQLLHTHLCLLLWVSYDGYELDGHISNQHWLFLCTIFSSELLAIQCGPNDL